MNPGKNNSSIISKFLCIIEKKNPLVKNHSINVCDLAVLICRKMMLAENEIELIMIAALLHDLGKIYVDNVILNKPSALSDDEYRIIKEHPVNGAEMAALFIKNKSIIRIICCHHERVDGKGYPRGLNARKIPLGAKIIAIADSYDAMVNTRPYREKPITKYEALREIDRCSGSQFEKCIADLFIRVMVEDGLLGISYK